MAMNLLKSYFLERRNMRVRKYGTKIGGIIAIIALLFGLIIFSVGWYKGKELHKNKIEAMINSLGGHIQQIVEINLEESPYIGTMESREGKRHGYDNIFYRIVYEVNEEEHIAWFRGVNGPFVQDRETIDYSGNKIEEIPENREKIKQYGEKWIIE